MKPGRRAVGKIAEDPQLEAEDAVVTDGTPLPTPGVIPRNEAIDVGQLAAGDALSDLGDLVVVHVECDEQDGGHRDGIDIAYSSLAHWPEAERALQMSVRGPAIECGVAGGNSHGAVQLEMFR
jgi:hypothetical protein